jgi:hypothetical protein
MKTNSAARRRPHLNASVGCNKEEVMKMGHMPSAFSTSPDLELLEPRALMDAAFASVGLRFDAGPSVVLAEGTVLDNNSVTGTQRTATLVGATGPDALDWTSLSRGASGSFTFGTRNGFTPYDSQNGTQFIGTDRWELGSFVGRDANGAARDLAYLMTPGDTGTLLYLDMRMTRLLPGGELESFQLLIFPTGNANDPAGAAYAFTYLLPTGAVTETKQVLSSQHGRVEFETGEVVFVNQLGGFSAQTPAIMADLDASDGIVGFATGGLVNGGAQGDAGRYRAAVLVEGPVAAAMFGLDPADVQNGPAVANVVIELHFWNNRDTESVPNSYSIYRQSDWDAGMPTPVTQGVWQYRGEQLLQPPFISVAVIDLLAPDFGSITMHVTSRSLFFAQASRNGTVEQLQGVGSAILARSGDILEMMVQADGDGHPVAYLTYGRDGVTSHVYSVDLVDEVGGEAVRGPLTTWVSVSSYGSNRYVAGLSQSGDVLLWRLLPDNVSWSFVNLTESLSGAEPIVSDLFSTGSITAAQYEGQGILPVVAAWQTLGGYDAEGDFVIYRFASGFVPQNSSRWESVDLGEQGVDGSGFIPQVVGGWTGWNTSWSGANFAGIDANGEMWVLWWTPGLNHWRVDSLTDRAGLPTLALARPAGLVTDWNAVHVGAIDTQGHLVVAWWAPSNDVWQSQDLTADFSGPTLDAGTLAAGFSYPVRTINFAGLDTNGAARTYWWAVGGTWQVDDVSRSTPLADIPMGPWTVSWSTYRHFLSFIYRQDVQSIYGSNDEGDLVRLVWRSLDADDWVLQNLTDAAVPFQV